MKSLFCSKNTEINMIYKNQIRLLFPMIWRYKKPYKNDVIDEL